MHRTWSTEPRTVFGKAPKSWSPERRLAAAPFITKLHAKHANPGTELNPLHTGRMNKLVWERIAPNNNYNWCWRLIHAWLNPALYRPQVSIHLGLCMRLWCLPMSRHHTCPVALVTGSTTASSLAEYNETMRWFTSSSFISCSQVQSQNSFQLLVSHCP
jgi:hypothetical protein